MVNEVKRIGVIDAYFEKFSSPGLVLCIKGNLLIDRAQTTRNATPSVVLILPCKFRSSNHRVILVNFEFE